MVATNQHLQPKRHHTNAFLFYSHEQLKHNKEGNYRLNKGVMKIIRDMWKLLSQDEKQKFLDMEQMSSAQYILDKAGLPKKARQLCEILVHNFNPKSCSLDIHDRQFNLTLKDVSDILGVRSNGCDIDNRGSLEGMESLHESVGVVNGVIPLDGLRKYLEDEKTVDAGDEFKRKFALYALGALLCPTTKVSLNVSSLHFMKDVEVMKNCNWGNLTLHSLVCGINIYQDEKGLISVDVCFSYCCCFFVMQLFYLDNVYPTFESTYATTRSIPCVNDWGDSQLKKTFQLFRKLGGFHNEVKVTFSKPNKMNDHHVDVVKNEIYDDMRHNIGELKHTMISMKEKIMNAPGDGVETRQQIGELKDVVYNLHQVIMKHVVRPDKLAAANGLDCFNLVAEKMNDNEGVKATNKIGATAKTKIAHNLMSEKNDAEESDGPSIEFLGVKERALKKGRKGQVIKEKEATGSPPEHSLPILGSQRGRGRGRGGVGGHRGRGRGQTKSSLMHATAQSVDMGDTSSCNDDYVAPITRSEEERRPAPCVRSPYFADGVKKVQKVNQVQTTNMLTDDDEDAAAANVNQVQN
ncbi:hypothetical protein RHSIM_Rhsim04G0060600 [Rhododendron simsii]|uniref:HMG box domain-containing protein n=1 Tax=Rhododendron simsii TaxID=118357 RepID=A0A834H7P5_RHOSS|nr:hypothetical protein RHSIM_Rhsim04G0060600 [Rhododendron simsii]